MKTPLVYEVNTRCWLRDLRDQAGKPVTLGQIPEEVIAGWKERGFTHIWLMGVWPTGPRSRTQVLQDPQVAGLLTQTLPGWNPEDVGGSPFAIAGYRVPRALGGESGLQRFRRQLRAQGLGLVLDFVPNHLGLDHAWLLQHPEYFVQATAPAPGTFPADSATGPIWIAHGKDPNFLPWLDTAQLDYRRPEVRGAMTGVCLDVARRCDGVRCDMSMLLLHDVFAANWAGFPSAAAPPPGEFWAGLIQTLRQSRPDFLFLAEVYWDLEARLQSLGFDYTYDKRLYDYLVYRNRGEVRRHLSGVSPGFIAASAHFLENHDEPRIASILSPAEHRAAALLTLALPGLRLLHEGQLTGARTRVPVQLARRPAEPTDETVAGIYDPLLRTIARSSVGHGSGELLPVRPAWPGNNTDQSLVVVQWRSTGPDFDLAVVNLAPDRSQGYVGLTVADLNRRNWRLRDLLGTEEYHRYGDDLQTQGLYLDLPPHAAQLFHFEPTG